MKIIIILIILCLLTGNAHAYSTAEQVVIGTQTISGGSAKWIPVGTQAPLPIAVYDSGNNQGYCYTSNGSGSPATFQVCSDGQGGLVSLGTSATAANPARAGDISSGLFTPVGSTVSVATAGLERLRVDANGKVDIGTTVTGGLVTIRGTDQSSGTSALLILDSGNRTILNMGDSGVLGIGTLDLGGATASNRLIQRVSMITSDSTAGITLQSSNASGPILFEAGGTSENMRVATSGSVGIGTTTPQSKLDVFGGISIGTSYAGVTASPTNGAIIQGNVGIGTSNPAGQLSLGNAAAHAGQAACFTTNGQMGFCTSVVGAGGSCTCTGL